MAIVTNLTQRLGIEHPILLAPMGFVAAGPGRRRERRGRLRHDWGGMPIPTGWSGNSLPLARAVSAVASSPGRSRSGPLPWTWLSSISQRRLCCRSAMRPRFCRRSSAGVLAMCQVQSLGTGRAVLRDGADIRPKAPKPAGMAAGVRPYRSCRRSSIWWRGRPPCVVAGGITDGRGLAAALMLGADGVVMGTRFSVASESLASPGQAR